ncbi:MAG: 30S ribosomal protein S4 [candidate division Zixibacteria bacterium]|nr:30S ribosomal protein S4 [candidate division Zixibacteria bacterium]NIR67715.1 30S ribosomal protein S4 [candidate division Zixibacteria bacterium]NIS16781.1 30S ribosomal protein S4 [candidate division Zixibacteria bacterium]NIS48968.1 30S ribosomal protein S4 [candidate division Zixibacteria bacterium]NIT53184.1 30S ribosomal protein S4 [candidate division Zixibacteria bacterium]
MARYRGSVCRLCRRESEKLFLKGSRCYSEKCAIERRNFPPGQHGFNVRRKISDYGIQLREKQKVKRIYGLLENQFHNYYLKATRQKGVTGENLLVFLETRLDNIIYRLGFAPSRKSARQLVRHRHFMVNGRVVDVPSYLLRPGDVVKVKEKSKGLDIIHMALRESDRAVDLPWLRVNKANLEGELLERPKREDIPLTCQEQLIVELYSK